MRRMRVRLRREQRGAAAVEFALILPLLCILVFGIINFGDMLSVRQGVSQAAAEGARAAAVDPGAVADKEAAAKAAVASALDAHDEACASWGTGSSQCSVTIQTCGTAQCAHVRVVIDYDALIPGFGLVLPDGLSYTAVARVS